MLSPWEARAVVGQCEIATPSPTSPLPWMRGAEGQGGNVCERFPAKTGNEIILFCNFLQRRLYLEIIPEQVRHCLAVPCSWIVDVATLACAVCAGSKPLRGNCHVNGRQAWGL